MAKFCPNCGTQLEDTAKFCKGCGEKLAIAAQPEPQPQQQTQPSGAPQQTFGTPQQTYGAQQSYQPQSQVQRRASAPGKKMNLRLMLMIGGGALLIMAITAVLIVLSVMKSLDETAKADYYVIGNDKIPSVKLALGEERKVSGASESTKDGMTMRAISYSVPGEAQNKEMSTYLDYLRDKDGFQLMTDVDFSKSESWGGLGRNSVDSGHEILLQIEYDKKGYIITLVRQEGEVKPNATPTPAPTPTPTPSPTPVPTPTPAPTPAIIAESVFETIDSGTYHMAFVIVGGDSDGSEMEIYKKDGVTALSMKNKGMSMRRITKDGKFYTVMDESKSVLVHEMDPSEIPPMEYESTQLTYVGEGTGEFVGGTYPYSKYTGTRGEQLFYFMDGGVLKGIRSISATGTTVDSQMRAFDKNVPGDVFTWPENYAVEDTTLEAGPWVGLWRNSDATAVALYHFAADGKFLAIARYHDDRENIEISGIYHKTDEGFDITDVTYNGKTLSEVFKFTLEVDGDTAVVNGEQCKRVPNEYIETVLADPLAPYPPLSGDEPGEMEVTFTLPDGWELSADDEHKYVCTVDGKDSADISFYTLVLDPGVTASDYVEAVLTNQKNKLEANTSLSDGEYGDIISTTINGHDAVEYTITYTYTGFGLTMKFRQREIFINKGRYMYYICYNANADEWDAVADDYETMLNSYTLK